MSNGELLLDLTLFIGWLRLDQWSRISFQHIFGGKWEVENGGVWENVYRLLLEIFIAFFVIPKD